MICYIYQLIYQQKIKNTDRIAYDIPSVIWETSREKYQRNEAGKLF
jgi:hypothetical protein